MTARLECCIPFCRRTTKNERGWGEWICQPHWIAVPKAERRVYSRAKRKARGTPNPATARLWRRLKRIAMERAGGI